MIKNLIHVYGIKFFFSDYKVTLATFSNGKVDFAIFLQYRKQPLTATKALCIEVKKVVFESIKLTRARFYSNIFKFLI